MQLPRYQCHKVVEGAKIMGIVKDGEIASLSPEEGDVAASQAITILLLDVDGKWENRPVTSEWVTKHKPTLGGYFVVYEDGYTSFSPADAFESGYSRIPTTQQA